MPLTILVVAILIVAGAAVAGTAVYFELRPAVSHVAGPTVTVVDDLGRTVVAPQNPQRVVALAPSLMDIVYRLGLRDRVVGIGCNPSIAGGIENEYTPNQTALWGLSAAMCIPDFPTLSVGDLLNRTPQLVLAATLTSAADVEELSATYHLPVVLLAPATLEGIVTDVRLVGQIFPAAPTTDSLVALLDQELVSAERFDANLSTNGVPLPTVLLTYYYDSGGYFTYGPSSFGQSLIDLIGGVNLAGSSPLVYFELNASAVLAANPPVIVYGTSWNDPWIVSNETPAQWQSTQGGGPPYWGQLTGAKDAVDIVYVTEASPSLILALPLFLHLVHPTLVTPP